ncbi:MAG: hypothetical protein C0504_01930 [Candidatus Solibacter sp.]|nr:hypothetical protein [Candidatus Solibacter sp.]
MQKVFRVFLIGAAMACAMMAQEPLNNEGVIKLVKAGMTEELIISVIKQQPGVYTMGAAELVVLKEASVSEKIIAEMLNKASSQVAGLAGVAVSGAKAVTDAGLFYRKGNEYFELLSENVEWKSKGAVKNIASAGIVKKNIAGTVTGPSSRNFLTNPMEIVLSPGQGITINSFFLLPLKPKDGVREFTVGPVNKQSGVARGAIPFGVEKMGENSFRMVLQTPLGPGEYGILNAVPSSGDAEPSKMYTFRILL